MTNTIKRAVLASVIFLKSPISVDIMKLSEDY